MKTGGMSRIFRWYNGSLERDSVLLYETCFCLLALSAMNEIGDSMGRGTLEQVICSMFHVFGAFICGMSVVASFLELNGIARASFRILHYCKNEEGRHNCEMCRTWTDERERPYDVCENCMRGKGCVFFYAMALSSPD